MNKMVTGFLVACAAMSVAGLEVVESAKEIPVAADVDVLVVGGTSGGVAAALAAKEAGARVYLAGGYPYLGEDVAGTLELGDETTDVSDPIVHALRHDVSNVVPYEYTHAKGFKYVGGWGYHNDGQDKFKVAAPPHNANDSVLYLEMTKIFCTFKEPEEVGEIEVYVMENADPKYPAIRSVDHRGAITDPTAVGPLTGRVVVKVRSPETGKWKALELTRDEKSIRALGSGAGGMGGAPTVSTPVQGGKCVVRYARKLDMKFSQSCVVAEPAKGAACHLVSRIHFKRPGNLESFSTPSPLKAKKTFDSLLLGAGVEFLTGAPVTDLVVDGRGEVAGAVIANRSGRQAILAKSVVDATRYGVLTRLGSPVPGIGGATAFTRQIVAGKMSERTREELSINMADGSYASFAAAELEARDQTWRNDLLDAADLLRLVNVPEPVKCPFIHAVVDRGTLGEKLQKGRAAGKAAAAEAAGRRVTGGVRVAGAAPGKDAKTVGRVCEPLKGLRPYDASLTRRTIPETARELPVLATYDVVVVGGGTAGAPAAVGAARAGAKTLVVEYLHMLGGVGTDGMILGYYSGNRCGFTAEFDARKRKQESQVKMGIYKNARAYTGLAREAGATIWYGAFGAGTVVENGRVKGVVVVTPQGRGVVLAGCVVDATGNSDVAAAAGAATEFIGAGDFALQSAGQAPHRLGRNTINSDFSLVNDPCAWDLWVFGVRSRAGQPDAWDVAQIVDSRERRRIVPDYRLEGWDVVMERPFRDTICQAWSQQDSHGFLKDEYGYVAEARKDNDPRYISNIPYRSYLPKGLAGIAVVGLGKGVARDVVPMTRMRADEMNEGYAMGRAAALAAKSLGGDLRKVDVKELQKHLVEVGVLRPEVLGWTVDETVSDDELKAAMATVGDGFKGAGLALAYPDRALPYLRENYRVAKTVAAKQAYAIVLGVLGDATGAEDLARMVDGTVKCEIRRGGVRFGKQLANIGMAVALGRTKAARAIEPIRKAITGLQPNSKIGEVRLACLAAEAHGSPAFAAALTQYLKQPGVGGWARKDVRELAPTGGYGLGPEVDQVIRELTVARALYVCGDPEGLGKRTLEAYARDPRGAFAEHANKVLQAGPRTVPMEPTR